MPGSAESQEVAKLKEKIYQRVGEWIFKHWTQIAAGIGGVIGGASTVYFVLASHVENIQNAQVLMTANVATLTTDVATLNRTVEKLATKDFVEAKVAPIAQWETDHGALPNNKEAEDALKLPPHRGRGPPHH